MIRNIPVLERVLRGVVGLCVLGLFGALPSPARYLTLLGLVPLGTAITGFCPLYATIARRRSMRHPS